MDKLSQVQLISYNVTTNTTLTNNSCGEIEYVQVPAELEIEVHIGRGT